VCNGQTLKLWRDGKLLVPNSERHVEAAVLQMPTYPALAHDIIHLSFFSGRGFCIHPYANSRDISYLHVN
jgi:hypothetical protein